MRAERAAWAVAERAGGLATAETAIGIAAAGRPVLPPDRAEGSSKRDGTQLGQRAHGSAATNGSSRIGRPSLISDRLVPLTSPLLSPLSSAGRPDSLTQPLDQSTARPARSFALAADAISAGSIARPALAARLPPPWPPPLRPGLPPPLLRPRPPPAIAAPPGSTNCRRTAKGRKWVKSAAQMRQEVQRRVVHPRCAHRLRSRRPSLLPPPLPLQPLPALQVQPSALRHSAALLHCCRCRRCRCSLVTGCSAGLVLSGTGLRCLPFR